ncbi:(deoxy)nucleoside triphosphate pyrophosphohydrolase [Planctomycetota bacterium]|nr:(deoxy)nucleoside triphosphate pyrophosphohydrolase [Planctomycetota bacterium]
MSSVIRVGIGVLVHKSQDNVRVLIAKRPDTGVLPGYWEFPGGKLEPNESLEHCVVREFEEELGAKVRILSQLDSVLHKYDYGTVELNPFFCEWLGGELQNHAVVDHQWVRPEDLLNFSFPEANTKLVEQVIRELTHGMALAS